MGYESSLKRAGVPSGEISVIVHNLEKLEGAEFRGNIDTVIGKLGRDSSFRASFIRDYKVAMR
ncbi:MAG: hypothetical protein ACTSV3_08420 [Candidatus Thorarchaeota archaeon]|nr:MAG: hypothetical protein DRP09_12455 [Candidatus Thorarchaeota archaeon]